MAKRISGKVQYLTIGTESTWGTAVAPTAMLPFSSKSFSFDPEKAESGNNTGSRAYAGSQVVGMNGKASHEFGVNLDSFGWLFKGALGSETVSGTGPYTHTFTVGSGDLPSYTFVDTVGPYSYTVSGAVLDNLSFAVNPKAIISAKSDFVFKSKVSNAIALLPANIVIATDIISYTNTFTGSELIRFRPSDATSILPAPLVAGTDYYVSAPTGTGFKVSATAGGTAIDLTTIGTGNFEFVVIKTFVEPSNAVLSYRHSSLAAGIKVDGSNFGEANSLDIAFSNNLATDDYRLGTGGLLGSVVGGAFDGTAKLKVNKNEATAFLETKYVNNQTISLTVDINEDATFLFRVYFPALEIVGMAENRDDSGVTLDFDLKAKGGISTSPVTVTLINSHSGAY